MSFGFDTEDFIAATEYATRRLDAVTFMTALGNEANHNSVIILSFRSLQAQRIKDLQHKLHQISLKRVGFAASGSTPAGSDEEGRFTEINQHIDQLLNNYAEAIRNYETLSQEALHLNALKRDSRIQRIIRYVFRLPKPKRNLLAEMLQELSEHPNLNFNCRELNKDIREGLMRKQAFSERIWMGALGGFAVIGPMLLMSLHRSLTTSLVTSSVATVLFALVLALGARNLKGQEVLGAVAAYAAVLVVFIGTSIPPVS